MTINWITKAQVKAAAAKSDRAALAMSLRHWKQLAAAGKVELLKTRRANRVSEGEEYCALCQRAGSPAPGFSCGRCPLHRIDQNCRKQDGVYRAAATALDKLYGCQNDPVLYTEWRRAARAMRDLLQRLYDEGKK